MALRSLPLYSKTVAEKVPVGAPSLVIWRSMRLTSLPRPSVGMEAAGGWNQYSPLRLPPGMVRAGPTAEATGMFVWPKDEMADTPRAVRSPTNALGNEWVGCIIGLFLNGFHTSVAGDGAICI